MDSDPQSSISNDIVAPIDLPISKIQHCQCLTKTCECQSNLNLTKGVVDCVLNYYKIIPSNDFSGEGLRENAIHLYGVNNLSTDDLNHLWPDFTYQVEWVNDYSCNLVFSKLELCIQFFDKYTEECIIGNEHKHIGKLANTIWRKIVHIPENVDEILSRFAKITDVKPRGAEKRSQYYKEHGNPNYGNMVGLISRSYRQRLKETPQINNNDIETETIDSSALVVYDDLPILDDNKTELENSFENDEENLEVTSGRKRKMIVSMQLYSDAQDKEMRNKSHEEEDTDVSMKKKHKMLVSMKLYSDAITQSGNRKSTNVDSLRKSVHSRLG